ncbi:putative reverse transcriptase domain-containing protein [Tanacetum coccineum]
MEEDKETDEVEEVSEDDEEELLKHLVIKMDKDIAIDAIPLTTKLPVIVDYKLHKEGMLVHYQLIRAYVTFKRYSSMIRMLQRIAREDLEVLWRIVKAKHNDTRPEDEFERSKVTTVSIKISTAGTYYCLCSVSAAGYKDTTVADLQLLEDLLLCYPYINLRKTRSVLRTITGARDTEGGQVVQQSRIQYFNCKEFGHFAKECKKLKHQSDWLANTDEEIDEQELEAHYSYMEKIQEVPNADSCTDSKPLEHVQYDTGYNVFANEIPHSEQSESISNTCVVETGDSNVIPDSPDMCDNDIQNNQNAIECDDERVALANLIANLKLDVDENKKIQKQ